uniref:Protein kinase domain-containing protein n=1 Tax=Zooxanthella nutricula TaxID=1333877 RepID=A0A7S2JV26_9DINO
MRRAYSASGLESVALAPPGRLPVQQHRDAIPSTTLRRRPCPPALDLPPSPRQASLGSRPPQGSSAPLAGAAGARPPPGFRLPSISQLLRTTSLEEPQDGDACASLASTPASSPHEPRPSSSRRLRRAKTVALQPDRRKTRNVRISEDAGLLGTPARRPATRLSSWDFELPHARSERGLKERACDLPRFSSLKEDLVQQDRCESTFDDGPTPSAASFSPWPSSAGSGSTALPPSLDGEVRLTPVGKDWKKGAQIGCGSYGCVYKARDSLSGRIFAAKETPLDRGSTDQTQYFEKLEMEIDICKSLRHPNIVGFLGFEYTNGFMYIFLEYVAGGSMAHVLREFGPLSPVLLTSAAKGCAEGLCYLHARDPPVVHRDIKCANILVDVDFCVKLADFGCSKRHADTQSFTAIGSVPWMAPEVIRQTGYGRRSDVWSLGCVAIEMATARHPWGSFDNPMAAMMRIGMSEDTPPLPERVSEGCRAFIKQCTQRDRERRPHASELLSHEFVRSDVMMSTISG